MFANRPPALESLATFMDAMYEFEACVTVLVATDVPLELMQYSLPSVGVIVTAHRHQLWLGIVIPDDQLKVDDVPFQMYRSSVAEPMMRPDVLALNKPSKADWLPFLHTQQIKVALVPEPVTDGKST